LPWDAGELFLVSSLDLPPLSRSQLNQDRSSSGRRDRKKDEKNDNRKDESIDKNDKNISKRRMSERKKSSSDSDSSVCRFMCIISTSGRAL
jgi:hypothetical protein